MNSDDYSANLANPSQAKGAQAAPAAEQGGGVGGWLARNRWFTKEPITYTAYQFMRAAIAAIPYGFAMAAGHHLFGLFSVWGQKGGLTEKGRHIFEKEGGLKAVEQAASEARKTAGTAEKIFKTGSKALWSRNLMRFAHSPMNAVVQIAMGFTLFRFTGGIVKNVRDRVMNEKNSEADTKREIHAIPKTIAQTAAINWPAESTGTPIAALALGFMNAAFTPSIQPIRDVKKYPKFKGFVQQVKQLWGAESKLLQNAAVWTVSYSTFFLLAESLFKDMQLRRGLWKGHPNSLKNGPDDTVGGPGAVNYRTPEDDPAKQYTPHHRVTRQEAGAAKDSDKKLKHPTLTGEPSWGRFIFRRVLPVGLGISAYAALKRVGYLGAGGPMKPLGIAQVEEMKTAGQHARFWLENARREGLATIMFGALFVAADAGGSFYDKFVEKLQRPGNQVPLNAQQQANHAVLLERLNAKERETGRAA